MPGGGRPLPEGDGTSAATGREQRIADTFVALSDTLDDDFDFDVAEYLCTLTRRCVELLPVTGAGALLSDQGGQLHPMAASDEATGLLDEFELEHGEGPGLDCFRSGTPIADASLAEGATVWPAFAARARGNGYVIAHAVPLRIRDTVVGALSLFADTPDRLPDPDLALGGSLAQAAAIGILHQRAVVRGAETTAQLQQALTSRTVIEQAKGVLAERMQIPVDDAFAILRAHARSHSRRLSEVARAVADGADLASPDNDRIRPR